MSNSTKHPARSGIDVNSSAGFFRQPRAVYVLSATEFWERFSFYGLMGLLVLFLSAPLAEEGFGWSDAEAVRLFGLYSALAFATPVFGGWIADRYLGAARSVIIGGVIIALGHFLLAGPALLPLLMESITNAPIKEIVRTAGQPLGALSMSVETMDALQRSVVANNIAPADIDRVTNAAIIAYRVQAYSFYIALGLIILGTGFFKPSVTAIVDRCYAQGDPRRTMGFALFWVGINVGSLAANFIAGTLGERVGWHWGLGAAGVGMLGALIIFYMYRSLLPASTPIKRSTTNTVALRRLTEAERRRLQSLAAMAIFALIFFICFLQKGGLLNVYTREADRVFFGFEIPTTWFLSINPFVVLVCTPFLMKITSAYAGNNRRSEPVFFFTAALLCAGAAYGVLLISELLTPTGAKPSAVWLVPAYIAISVGEIMLWPTALAMVTDLAPVHYASVAIGSWYLVYALAAWTAGELGGWAQETRPANAFALLLGTTTMAAVVLWYLADLILPRKILEEAED